MGGCGGPLLAGAVLVRGVRRGDEPHEAEQYRGGYGRQQRSAYGHVHVIDLPWEDAELAGCADGSESSGSRESQPGQEAYSPVMSTPETSRYVRLHVELVLEISDPEQLTAAALTRIASDDSMPDEERDHARSSVREDGAEAVAYLVEPSELVSDVPGVELAQASWSSEEIDYDPEAVEWDLDEEDEEAVEEGVQGRPGVV